MMKSFFCIRTDHVLNALNNFSEDQLRIGEPYSMLNDRLVPMYFLHRYQAEAIVKLIGGVDYSYGVKGPIAFEIKVVDNLTQRAALKAMINSLAPETLAIPISQRAAMAFLGNRGME